VLPEGESGRGRGTRAFVRKLSTGAVIHDASYWCPVLLSGPFTAVTRCLNIIIDPEIVKLLAVQLGMRVSNSIGCEIEAMLHEMHCFPAKALSPVKILALPSHRKEHKEYAKLYIWIHGAGIKEAFRALKAAVDTIKNTTGECVSETAATAAAAALVEATPQSDNLSLVVGDARRIEMRGSKSDHVLLHALFSHNKTTKIDSKPCLPQKLRSLRPGQAALVVLPDPRLSKPIILGSRTCSSLLDADSSNKVDFDIFNHRYPSPSTEAAISQARKDARHQLMVAGEAATDPRTQGEEEEALTASLQGPTHCGAIFIRGYKGLKSSTGWSIILPPGWVMPIWVALAFQGCRATGQREWRWLHTLDHRSLFPYDVPDSHVYNTYIEKQHEHRELKDKKRPPAKRFDLPQAEGVGWEHLSELYINSNERSSIEVEGRILSTRLLNNANVFVARSESSMLQALFGWAAEAAARFSSAGVFSGSSLRPVANALASRKLQWVPRNVPKHLGRDLCLVEAAIHIINQGVINENATIFVIWKHEAQLSQGQPCYLKYKGTYHPEEPDTRYAEHEKLIPIGFITSPAPQATGRETASMAVVTAAAFWRLRSLQYSEYRRDRGTVEAWIQNSRSSVIYPVRLSLLIERK
jgi:ribonuclease P/MRP protein subunit POP1